MMVILKKKQDVGLITVSLLLLGLLLTFTLFQSAMAAEDSAGGGLCESKCGNRCSKAGVQDRCLKYCRVCCAKCQCVPSGTYGNKHECPCYRDMINSKGKPKCP